MMDRKAPGTVSEDEHFVWKAMTFFLTWTTLILCLFIFSTCRQVRETENAHRDTGTTLNDLLKVNNQLREQISEMETSYEAVYNWSTFDDTVSSPTYDKTNTER